MMGRRNYEISEKIAECTGLWLAEGDNKCNNKINFSNNCPELITLFHKNMKKLFRDHTFNIRLYIYARNPAKVNAHIKVDTTRRYINKKANKPYFIWRLASVKLNKEWKGIVKSICSKKKFEVALLRGFFAGEGNIKIGSHNSRVLRIAQKRRIPLIERILDNLSVTYTFRAGDRSYYIYNRKNWDKLAKISIADLHPLRKKKFYKAYNQFTQYHHKPYFIRNNLLNLLNKPKSTKELAHHFKRSPARIYDILSEFKKSNLIINYRIGSCDYWIKKSSNTLLISKTKQKYLNVLKNNPLTTKEISVIFKVCWKSSFRRLKELEKLGLAKRANNKRWYKTKTNKKVIVI